MPPCAGRAGQSYKENAINLEPELLPFVSVRPSLFQYGQPVQWRIQNVRGSSAPLRFLPTCLLEATK